MFGIVLISICTLMHVYLFWRAASVPFLTRNLRGRVLIGFGVFLWVILVLGRFYGHGNRGTLAWLVEFTGMTWIGVLLLVSTCLVGADVLTGFGYLWPRRTPLVRGCALIGGGLLSGVALVQGVRAPVVESYTVHLSGLPPEMDGTVVVGMSDWHVGALINERWLAARVDQAKALEPDLVVLLGDLFEGHGQPPNKNLLPVLRKLSAPLGVWAVLGNHEHYGRDEAVGLMEQAGIHVLRNRWVRVRPGLTLAGVDDLTVHRRRNGDDDLVSRTLTGGPEGATILLSHTPWDMKKAAGAGADLMLCGHTHGGQIWPFGYLVRRVYPLLAGAYEVDGMPVIVSRGTGRWGPPMRLWPPGEILRITLQAD